MSPRVQLFVLLAAETALYSSYAGHDARFHWFTHLMVGAITALALMTARTLQTGRPARHPLLHVLFWHIVAMLPDLLFVGGVPHQQWMDVFLGHISSHFVPGRNLTWMVVLSGMGAVATFVQLDAAR